MAFFETPAFFILLAIAAIPAIVLGCLGRNIKWYGCIASAFFLLLLFSRDLRGFACFVFLLALSVALIFYTHGLFAKDAKHKIAKYRIALVIALAPLIIYKVSAIFDGNLLGFIGISYMTFKVLQVLIEIRDGAITDVSLFSCVYFLIFFTPFTSGPIMRSREFDEDLARKLTPGEYRQLLYRGLGFLIVGAVYKFVLSALFSWAMWFLPNWFGSAGAGAWLSEAWGYTFFLFFDFAGYSLMAVGAGCLFGIRVPMNFNAPFRSLDMKDFWNRWHMSLSFWLRDYVFMRIMRTCVRRHIFQSRLVTACLGYMADMLIIGIWHGLTANFAIYGLYHGVLLSLTEVFQKKSKFYKKHKKKMWFKAVSWFVTMHLVMFGLAIFSGQILFFGGM